MNISHLKNKSYLDFIIENIEVKSKEMIDLVNNPNWKKVGTKVRHSLKHAILAHRLTLFKMNFNYKYLAVS